MTSTNLINRIIVWNHRRQRCLQVQRELEAYTDRQLTDLGIARWDIPRVARESVG